MNRLKLKPNDKNEWLAMRASDITSTEISALFGVSPYATEFEIWHRHKSGDILHIEDNERMRWGTRLESAIAKGVADDNGWSAMPFKEYMRLPDHRLGSSFDFMLHPIEAILEIKNVDALIFRDQWEKDDDGNIEAPLHIELQVQHQMLVSGLERAFIAALVGGNQLNLLERKPNADIHNMILKHAERFWKSIDTNAEPTPDFARDADTIARLYSYAEPNKVIVADEKINHLAEQYKIHSDAMKQAEEKRDAIKAELLTLIGDSEKCKGETYSISAGMVSAAMISYQRKPYRNFKVTFKKGKKDE